jgi:hypothetical protein
VITILDQSTATCLAVHFSGKVTGQEYQQFLDAPGERLKTGDQQWIVWFTRFVGSFTRAEEKQFPAGQLETAFNWACA